MNIKNKRMIIFFILSFCLMICIYSWIYTADMWIHGKISLIKDGVYLKFIVILVFLFSFGLGWWSVLLSPERWDKWLMKVSKK